MEVFKQTLAHALELIIVLGASWTIMHYLGADSETGTAVTAIVLGSLAKFARASDSIPVGDWVNNQD